MEEKELGEILLEFYEWLLFQEGWHDSSKSREDRVTDFLKQRKKK